jgi:hypothetical protein
MMSLSRLLITIALLLAPLETSAQARTQVERQQEIARYCGEVTLIIEDNATRLHNWIIRHTAGMSGDATGGAEYIKILPYDQASVIIEETGRATRKFRDQMHLVSLKKGIDDQSRINTCRDLGKQHLAELVAIYNKLSNDGQIP